MKDPKVETIFKRLFMPNANLEILRIASELIIVF